MEQTIAPPLEDLIERALLGMGEEWEDEEPLGDHPLEHHPEQGKIKEYLVRKGYLVFRSQGQFRRPDEPERPPYVVNVLGERDNLSWCCDPACDRVIVGIPMVLFIEQGHIGTVEFHWACANRLIQQGVLQWEQVRDA